MLFHQMGEKKEDDEVVLQITVTFAVLLRFAPTAAALLENTEIVHYLVDLLQDNNKEVRCTTSSTCCKTTTQNTRCIESLSVASLHDHRCTVVKGVQNGMLAPAERCMTTVRGCTPQLRPCWPRA